MSPVVTHQSPDPKNLGPHRGCHQRGAAVEAILFSTEEPAKADDWPQERATFVLLFVAPCAYCLGMGVVQSSP
eukprot:CAMPEP_0206502356 /NCGR_PEP_ID=MMETSP0324_2-20121206/53950_1 /ASSEMBLY_ACC=CAM_ASM_000836 /TAXON_ID=2866 /ORGANISM="Crypthecodinium cohnii, Strain Seligo" /LENGTH=72 /DNA_ID=CAMNT_0053990537 /DNA_START=145 /DNA_END=359 /DNA_ORIENTATION=-